LESQGWFVERFCLFGNFTIYTYFFVLSRSLSLGLGHLGRRERYENLIRYYVEKEWLGELERNVRTDQTRSLTMDHMGPDEFDDNDRFGDVSDFASESDAQGSDSEASSTDMPSSEATSDYASKRSRKRKSKGKDKRGDNPPSKRRQKSQEEEPLEDPGSLNFLSQTNMLCQSFH